MANTTNFGWETPDDTDLVKDGAAAMRTLGNAIDTSLVDLKGGTTGQVLSKTSNTDMDFTWVTSDDANAIQNAIVDAKGDLISATAADTPARLAVGNNGETLVADSSATTGLRWQGNFAAGKNLIINGDLRINQRAFSSTTTNGAFGFDRLSLEYSGGTGTYSAQTFTAGTAPVAGYEAINFARLVTASQSANGDYASLKYRIEDVRTLAGQTATFSVWAKASTGTPKIGFGFVQNFGTGGSADVIATNTATSTISSSWARYSVTVSIPSISGKTIGTGSFLQVYLFTSVGTTISGLGYPAVGLQNVTIDFWGLQLEAGSVATAFQTATGTLAGELAACQRYYVRFNADQAYSRFGMGTAQNADRAFIDIVLKTTMRTASLSLDTSATSTFFAENDSATAATGLTSVSILANGCTTNIGIVEIVKTGAFTSGRAYRFLANNSTSAYLGFSAEL